MIQIENISNNTIYARLLATAHNHPDLTDGHQGWVGVHIDGLAYASEAEKLVFARVKLDISVEMFPFVPGNSPRWVEMPGWRFEARDVRAAQALALAAWGKRS